MPAKLSSAAMRIIHGLAVFVVCTVLLLNVVFHAAVSYDGDEIVSISLALFSGVVTLIGIGALLWWLSRASSRFARLSPALLFAALSVVYGLLSAWLICGTSHSIRADASNVFVAAQAFRNGDYSAFQPGKYLSIYPHQLGMMTFDLLLDYAMPFAVGTTLPCFLANTVLVLGINLCCWRISLELSASRGVQLLTIFLSFAFFPQFLFIRFAYGQIPGLFFLMLSFLFTLRFCREHRWPSVLGLVLCLSASILIRQNNLVGAIAIGVYLLLHLSRRHGWKTLGALAAVLACMLVPSRLLTAYYEARTETSLQEGMPTVLWVAMGTDVDNVVRGPGWYDESTMKLYRSVECSAAKAADAGMEKLRNNWEKIKADPTRAAGFFSRKIISTWCDPLYQSVWSGPLPSLNQQVYPPLLQSLYQGGWVEKAANACARAVTLVIYLGVCVFLLHHGRQKEGWPLVLLYFLGGFLFHILWETKSQYVYPYVFCLIPFAADGLRQGISLLHQGSMRFSRSRR